MKENEEKEVGLFKVRSYSSCIAEGFALPLKNFTLLLKYLWPSLLITIIFTVWMIFEVDRMAIVFLYQVNSLREFFLQHSVWVLPLLLFVCAVLAFSLYVGQLIALIKKYGETGRFTSTTFIALNSLIWKGAMRYFVYFISTVLFSLVCVSLSWFLLGFSAWSVLMAAVLIILLFTPFVMVGLHYCLGQSSFFNSFVVWKTGFRFWGAFFSILLVGGLASLVLGIFGGLPALVLLGSSAMAKLSELEGDISDLPAYFPAVKVFFYAIGALVSLLSVWFSFFSLSFLYGSIEKRRQEQKVFEAEQEVFLKDVNQGLK